MCYNAFTEKARTKRIAGEDIKVYKIVSYIKDSVISIHKNYKYEPLKVNPTEDLRIMKTSDLDYSYIDSGYHSYRNCRIVNYVDCLQLSYKFAIYDNLLSISVSLRAVLGEFIIPKGAEYYENTNEIVSNMIIFTGIIHKPCIKNKTLYTQTINLNNIKND